MPPSTASRRSVAACSSSAGSADVDDSPKDQLLSSGVLARALPARDARRVRLGADRLDPRHQEGQRRVRPRRPEDAVRQRRGHADPAGRSGRGGLDDRRRVGLRRRSRRRSAMSSSRPPTSRSSSSSSDEDLAKWQFLKGAKSLTRISRSTGMEYTYDEGPIPFPDPTDRPSRTILTGEGGATASRFKHLIQTEDGRFRRLTPRELERLNGFPGDWTAGMSDGKRAFMMGNALVVGLVERVADALDRGRRRPPSRSADRRATRSPPSAVVAGLQLPNPPPTQSGRPQRHARQPRARHGPGATPAEGAPRRAISAAIA